MVTERHDRGAPACRNCGRPAGPRLCGHCGQEVEARRGPLLPLLHELLSEWLSLDGRLVRTLRRLWKPGRLTRLYLESKRAAYLQPMRLYFVASLALFSSVLALRTPDVSQVNLVIGSETVSATGQTGRPTVSLYNSDSLLGRWLARQSEEKLETLRQMPPQELLDPLVGGGGCGAFCRPPSSPFCRFSPSPSRCSTCERGSSSSTT